MIQEPSVAIVILNWNTAHYLERFLPAILSCTYTNKTVYVIDNDSKDESIRFLESRFPTVRIIAIKENLGFAGGYNVGLAHIQSDYFLIVNSDLEVSEGFIEPLISLMERDLQIAACQPKLLSLDDKTMFEYAGAAGGYIDKWGFPFTRGRVLTTIERDEAQYDNTAQVFWATGACMCIRSSIYHQTEGFYNYFYMQQEDIDLCWRLRNMGYTVYACPDSIVYHMGGGSLSWEDHLKTQLTFRNNYILLARNLQWWKALPIILMRLIFDLGACIYFLGLRKPGISKAVFRAGFAFAKWLIIAKNKFHAQPKGWPGSIGIYKGTILFPYFLGGKKKFSELVPVKRSPNA